MYPLLFFSILSIALIIQRGLVISRAQTPKAKLAAVTELVKKGDYKKAEAEYADIGGPAASLGKRALSIRELPKKEMEERISSEGSRELKSLTRNLHLLELVGKIAPMVGLSGTVLGLAGTFQKVSLIKNISDPSVLASGIWEALITTVSGLFIAIPAIIFFHLYENKVKSISFEMRDHLETVISILKA